MSNTASLRRAIPQAQGGYPWLGVLPLLRSDPLGTLARSAAAYGGIVQIGQVQQPWFLISDPSYIKHVFQDHSQNYRRGLNAKIVTRLIGNGLAISSGESWLRQRRLMQPAFQRRHTAGFIPVIIDVAQRRIERWARWADQGDVIDLSSELLQMTQQILLRTMFGTSLVEEKFDLIAQALTTVIDYIDITQLTPLPLWVPTAKNRAFQRALDTLNTFLYRIIAERRKQPPGSDLLSLLLAARDERDGSGMDDRQLRDEMMTIFVAGHETITTALAWAWYLLATHPDAEARLHEEVDRVLGGRTPAEADIPNLVYTRCVFDETLRLYPPAWLLTRSPYTDDEIDGYHIPASAIILSSPYVVQRHPRYWDWADQFRPERFLPGQAVARPPFAYFPFGGGPHLCIGNHVAVTEAVLIISMVSQVYRVRFPAYRATPHVSVTLRPQSPMPAALSRR